MITRETWIRLVLVPEHTRYGRGHCIATSSSSDGVDHALPVFGKATVPVRLEPLPGKEGRDRVGVEHTESGRFDRFVSQVHEPLLFEHLEFPREVVDRVAPEERLVVEAFDSQGGKAAGQMQDA